MTKSQKPREKKNGRKSKVRYDKVSALKKWTKTYDF